MGASYQESRPSRPVVLAFYYGSYMDPDVLRKFGAHPGEPQRAALHGWRLAYTPHANLVPDDGLVEGVVYDLPQAELDCLYGPGGYVTTYRPVDVEVDGRPMQTFVEDAPEAKPDPEYLASLRALMDKVGLPAAYIEAVT